MEYPKRKPIRLNQFNYAANGVYFVTVCTQNRACILSQIRSALTDLDAPTIELTAIGRLADAALASITKHYPNVSVDAYVVMPNHIHILMRIESDGRQIAAPTVSRIVGSFKRFVSMQSGKSIWQKGFYDHIIRNEQDYDVRVKYIDDNPAKWVEDEYYSPPAR